MQPLARFLVFAAFPSFLELMTSDYTYQAPACTRTHYSEVLFIIIFTVDNVNVSKTMHLHLGECGKLDMSVNLIVSDNFKKFESK